ncbi:hypothetical protein [Bailinhaonella thermotolerans]|nr:hypothetical protein [Bailinhaonella thermotolerans]
MRLERVRQLVGEVLLCGFVFVLLSGAFLALHYRPGGQVVYDGAYEPLRGVPMSGAYESVLRIGFEVPGGLLVRRWHHDSLVLLGLGTVVWALLGRYRYALTVLALGAIAGLSGYASADDVLSGTPFAAVAIPWWYALHILATAAMGVVLLVSSRREAAQQPRTLPFATATVGVIILATLLI